MGPKSLIWSDYKYVAQALHPRPQEKTTMCRYGEIDCDWNCWFGFSQLEWLVVMWHCWHLNIWHLGVPGITETLIFHLDIYENCSNTYAWLVFLVFNQRKTHPNQNLLEITRRKIVFMMQQYNRNWPTRRLRPSDKIEIWFLFPLNVFPVWYFIFAIHHLLSYLVLANVG